MKKINPSLQHSNLEQALLAAGFDKNPGDLLGCKIQFFTVWPTDEKAQDQFCGRIT